MTTYLVQVNCRDGVAEVDDFDDIYIVNVERKGPVTHSEIIKLVRDRTGTIGFPADSCFEVTELSYIPKFSLK